MIDFLSGKLEVTSVSKTLGNYELEFRVLVNNILELQSLIEDFKDKFPKEFIDFNIMVFVNFYKVLNYFPV